MDRDSPEVQGFVARIETSGLRVLWARYHKVHKLPGRWTEFTQKEFDEAVAWLGRMENRNPVLLEVMDALFPKR